MLLFGGVETPPFLCDKRRVGGQYECQLGRESLRRAVDEVCWVIGEFLAPRSSGGSARIQGKPWRAHGYHFLPSRSFRVIAVGVIQGTKVGRMRPNLKQGAIDYAQLHGGKTTCSRREDHAFRDGFERHGLAVKSHYQSRLKNFGLASEIS